MMKVGNVFVNFRNHGHNDPWGVLSSHELNKNAGRKWQDLKRVSEKAVVRHNWSEITRAIVEDKEGH